MTLQTKAVFTYQKGFAMSSAEFHLVSTWTIDAGSDQASVHRKRYRAILRIDTNHFEGRIHRVGVAVAVLLKKVNERFRWCFASDSIKVLHPEEFDSRGIEPMTKIFCSCLRANSRCSSVSAVTFAISMNHRHETTSRELWNKPGSQRLGKVTRI